MFINKFIHINTLMYGNGILNGKVNKWMQRQEKCVYIRHLFIHLFIKAFIYLIILISTVSFLQISQPPNIFYICAYDSGDHLMGTNKSPRTFFCNSHSFHPTLYLYTPGVKDIICLLGPLVLVLLFSLIFLIFFFRFFIVLLCIFALNYLCWLSTRIMIFQLGRWESR